MSTKYHQAFGDRVRQIREGLGLSQEALANQAKLHRTHISLIERGQRNVRIETVERLAKALRVQPAKLMPPVHISPADQ